MRHYWFLEMIYTIDKKQLYDMDKYSEKKETIKNSMTAIVMNE